MDAGHEDSADVAQAELGDLNEQLLEDAELVIARWERGDLAAAVRAMAETVKAIRTLEDEMASG